MSSPQQPEEENLQNLLGFSDANSSRGDISFNPESTGGRSSYSVYQVTTPRRQSHRPTPRRHSPQVPLAQSASTAPYDENSPECVLAFTPGNTKLDGKSLIALQRKFGFQKNNSENVEVPSSENAVVTPKRGLRASDSNRNVSMGKAELGSSSSDVRKEGPYVWKSSLNARTQNHTTPRISMIPRSTGKTSGFKRKIVVTFANSPQVKPTTPNAALNYDDKDASFVSGRACPVTPLDAPRRSFAGHTPGYIPPTFSLSGTGSVLSDVETSPATEGAVEPCDMDLSNLVASFKDSVSSSPEVNQNLGASLASIDLTDPPETNSVFYDSVSARPPVAPGLSTNLDLGVVPRQRLELSSSTAVDSVEACTPSSLCYSSANSCSSATGGFDEFTTNSNDFACTALTQTNIEEPSLSNVANPRETSLTNKPDFGSLQKNESTRKDYIPDSSLLHASTLQEPLFPLQEFSRSANTLQDDLYKTTVVNHSKDKTVCYAPNLKSKTSSNVDYDTEFRTVSTRSTAGSVTQRTKRIAPVSSFNQIGSPPIARLSNLQQMHRPINDKITPLEQVNRESSKIDNSDAHFTVCPLAAPTVPQLQTTGLCDPVIEAKPLDAPSRFDEVSLSRPGIRRNNLKSADSLCHQSVPYMMFQDQTATTRNIPPHRKYEDIIKPVDNNCCDIATASSKGIDHSRAQSVPRLAPSASTALSSSRRDLEAGVIPPNRIDVDVLCKEALTEILGGENSFINTDNDHSALAHNESSIIGLNEVLGPKPDYVWNKQKYLKRVTSETSAKPCVRTPSTGSSKSLLGTTSSSRVPSGHSMTRYCREDDDAPLYSQDDFDSVSLNGLKSNHVENKSMAHNDSVLSQYSTTTVAIDEDDNYANDFSGNMAQLCLTSREWNVDMRKHSRAKGPPEDVKEIVLYGKVGYTTSIVLSFRNKRSRGTKLQAKAILNRYEPRSAPSGSLVAPPDTFKAIADLAQGNINGFKDIAPDEKINITVEFNPFREGVFSGILKLRSKNKAFVLLLRGEADASGCVSQHDGSQRCEKMSSTINNESRLSNESAEEIEGADRDLSGVEDIDIHFRKEAIKQWIQSKLQKDNNRGTRERLKETYERARYARMLAFQGSNVKAIEMNGSVLLSKTEDSPTYLGHVIDTVKNTSSSLHGTGVYFRKEFIDFGVTSVGSISRLKIELCNSTSEAVRVHIGDPVLPFIVLHNDVTIPPNSFIRIPVRFVPVCVSNFVSSIYGHIINFEDNGRSTLSIQLSGSSV